MGLGGYGVDDVLGMLDRLQRQHRSWVRVAQELGVSPQYLGDVMYRRRAPGDKILRGLGLKAVTVYQKRGN